MEELNKIAFITLGCKVNQYESNAMAQKFINAGYKICSINEKPNIVIVNTCTVTNIADRKSRQTLRKIKEENPNSIIVATGCYVQVSKSELDNISEIDLSIGNVEKKDIVSILENFLKNKQSVTNIKDINLQKDYTEFGTITFSEKTRATIKIQDGCNNFCSYCLIPYARGRSRSRERNNIINEVKEIAKKGIKEIVLTGIHIGSYGLDFQNNYTLINLLEDLNTIDGIVRIRLGSLEPRIISEEFVKKLASLNKICNHFHLSLQSGCDSTLNRMNRKYNCNEFKLAVKLLRMYFKDVILTTDIIVGFPGETEEEFIETYNFLKEIKFYKMHVFKYSPRKGTIASKMPNQVIGSVKEERSKKLIELSNLYQNEYNKKYKTAPLEVLFEEKKGNLWSGYTTNYIRVEIESLDYLENKIITVQPNQIKT